MGTGIEKKVGGELDDGGEGYKKEDRKGLEKKGKGTEKKGKVNRR